MISINNKEHCTGCTACAQICPKKTIQMESDQEGFFYPKVDNNQCIKCGLCINVCPVNKKDKSTKLLKAYAITAKQKNVLMESSSGGVFYNIAYQVLSEGGVVFGATMTSELVVKHRMINDVNDIWCLMGSKYVQSNLGDTYTSVKEELKKRKVLFIGTPCQVEGLQCYLRKKYENLITVDFICHGVPSQQVFDLYIKYVTKINGEKVRNVKFRNKDISWREFSVMLEFESGEKKTEMFKENLWMRAFINNLFLRPSCYTCKFKRKERISDITLGDFWGIQSVAPEFYDEKGVSLCCVNSQKGDELLNDIRNEINIKKVDFEEAISYNTAYTQSATPNNLREWFFEHLDKEPLEKNIENCLKPNLVTRIVLKLRKIGKHNRRY